MNDRVPDIEQVREARELLAPLLPRTRLLVSSGARAERLWLKLECELPTGSFKIRGALYALSERCRRETIGEVVASSTGNHGAAVAYAARELRLVATIFVPAGANPVKLARIKQYGASVIEQGRDLAEAYEAATHHAHRQGAFLLNDATDSMVPAGAGTLALELMEDLPDLAQVIVPVGDSALIRGVGAVVKHVSPELRLIGVQAERAPAYARSWKTGRPTPTDSCDTIADGLATRIPDPANVSAIRALVDDFVLVSERELLEGVRRMILEEHVVAEPAGAAAYAAVEKLGPFEGRTAVIVSGANLSGRVLAESGKLNQAE